MMSIKSSVIVIFMGILLSQLTAVAQVQNQQVQNVSQSRASSNFSNKGLVNINWTQLNLSEDQAKKMNELDDQWGRIEQLIRPKIIRDQQQLKNIMSNPNADDEQIRNLQRDIMTRQEQLRFEATENFLSKRRILNTKQREVLHKMMPK